MARVVKKAAERRNEIIQAAKEQFQTQEYKKITMQGLTEKLNIAKGTLYHHFASKGEILEAVVEDIVDEELVRKQNLMSDHDTLPPLPKLIRLITDNSMPQEHEILLENLHHPENSDIHTRQLARFILKLAPLYASVISQGCQTGVFTTKAPLSVQNLLFQAFNFSPTSVFTPGVKSSCVAGLKHSRC